MSLDPVSTSPRVDKLITDVMKRFPGESRSAQARYYEEVHQHLAPLARELEAEVARLRVALYTPAPAISESDVLIVPARVGELIDAIKRDGLLKRAAEFSEMCRLIDAARKGEKS
ncbi:hypothetical protein [Burkholderia gladioli]|uniref:hypothetical protein n=1 Tax=Burkholderia gladioli TaxID=28095 RepID=UPI00163E2B59|nr:hypothetical protein [Burkholderia gladioli]